MIESLSQSNLTAITVGMLSILSLALGVLAITIIVLLSLVEPENIVRDIEFDF